MTSVGRRLPQRNIDASWSPMPPAHRRHDLELAVIGKQPIGRVTMHVPGRNAGRRDRDLKTWVRRGLDRRRSRSGARCPYTTSRTHAAISCRSGTVA
jgi:hypothetical protein